MPLDVAEQDTIVSLEDMQPGGILSNEYERPPYPPFVVTMKVTLSPASTFEGETVNDLIDRAELTVKLVVPLLDK